MVNKNISGDERSWFQKTLNNIWRNFLILVYVFVLPALFIFIYLMVIFYGYICLIVLVYMLLYLQ